MQTYEAMSGEHLDRAAERLVLIAKTHNDEATMRFNGIDLLAKPDSTHEGIVAKFNRETEARSEAYHNSPEGRAAAKDAEERRRAAQQTHDALMLQLPKLDFSDRGAVLDWLVAMQPASDHSGVVVRSKIIVLAFGAHGFKAGDNCGTEFKATDSNNVFRWIVGQALSCLKEMGAIHVILLKFAGEWKAKFHTVES